MVVVQAVERWHSVRASRVWISGLTWLFSASDLVTGSILAGRQAFLLSIKIFTSIKTTPSIVVVVSSSINDSKWEFNQLSNSHENNHSKVIESKSELKSKIGYLNKDQYFITHTDEYLGHLVPEYSDYQLWTTHKRQSNTSNKMWSMSRLGKENDICMNGC